jgi:hypothetical protein
LQLFVLFVYFVVDVPHVCKDIRNLRSEGSMIYAALRPARRLTWRQKTVNVMNRIHDVQAAMSNNCVGCIRRGLSGLKQTHPCGRFFD